MFTPRALENEVNVRKLCFAITIMYYISRNEINRVNNFHIISITMEKCKIWLKVRQNYAFRNMLKTWTIDMVHGSYVFIDPKIKMFVGVVSI